MQERRGGGFERGLRKGQEAGEGEAKGWEAWPRCVLYRVLY